MGFLICNGLRALTANLQIRRGGRGGRENILQKSLAGKNEMHIFCAPSGNGVLKDCSISGKNIQKVVEGGGGSGKVGGVEGVDP